MSRKNAKIFAFHRLCLVAANRLFTYSFTRPEKPPVEYVAPQHRRHLIYLATRHAGRLGASNGGLFWGPLDGKSQILRVDQISNQLISDESSWMIWICFPSFRVRRSLLISWHVTSWSQKSVDQDFLTNHCSSNHCLYWRWYCYRLHAKI